MSRVMRYPVRPLPFSVLRIPRRINQTIVKHQLDLLMCMIPRKVVTLPSKWKHPVTYLPGLRVNESRGLGWKNKSYVETLSGVREASKECPRPILWRVEHQRAGMRKLSFVHRCMRLDSENSATNVDVEAPPLLESEGSETEKLMGGCPLTPCSFSSSS